jgi:hypothetical protein
MLTAYIYNSVNHFSLFQLFISMLKITSILQQWWIHKRGTRGLRVRVSDRAGLDLLGQSFHVLLKEKKIVVIVRFCFGLEPPSVGCKFASIFRDDLVKPLLQL